MSVSLSVYVPLSAFLSISRVCLFLYFCLSVCLSICLFHYLSVSVISVSISVSVYLSLSVSLSLFMSVSGFQLHDWCNKGHGMCYPVCGMVHIKEPLLLIGKSSPCGGNLVSSLSEWYFTLCPTPYNRK